MPASALRPAWMFHTVWNRHPATSQEFGRSIRLQRARMARLAEFIATWLAKSVLILPNDARERPDTGIDQRSGTPHSCSPSGRFGQYLPRPVLTRDPCSVLQAIPPKVVLLVARGRVTRQ